MKDKWVPHPHPISNTNSQYILQIIRPRYSRIAPCRVPFLPINRIGAFRLACRVVNWFPTFWEMRVRGLINGVADQCVSVCVADLELRFVSEIAEEYQT